MCRGPQQRTASNAMIPSQVFKMGAQIGSLALSRSILPLGPYHGLPSSFRAYDRASCDLALSDAPNCAPGDRVTPWSETCDSVYD